MTLKRKEAAQGNGERLLSSSHTPSPSEEQKKSFLFSDVLSFVTFLKDESLAWSPQTGFSEENEAFLLPLLSLP